MIQRVSEIKVITDRQLRRDEIEYVWTIDRSEVIDNVYHLEQAGLALRSEHRDLHGWPPGEAERYAPLHIDCFARGGWLHGVFDEGKLIGAGILDSRFIGRKKDQLRLTFLHIGKAYRKRGLGRRLFELAKAEARERGAKRLYISAAPSQNTVDFYRRLGCELTRELALM